MAALMCTPTTTQAGDILRGGASGASGRKNADARSRAGAEAANVARTTGRDRLARTTQAITAVRQMQQGAAEALTVPDGLVPGGLQRATGLNARWDGAQAPVEAGNTVTIKQTQSQAMLHWETFNVGRNTTLRFDQSDGKGDAGKWIAFNKVFDPAAAPSKILGAIKAEGQVYILNQNGIIFGARSQVNVRALVASALPINDNLVADGLLNNPDAQFLFSGLPVLGSTTSDFLPPAPPPSGRYGDVTVHPGANLQSSINSDGNGGRIMLVGANVVNEGSLSAPSGQVIVAAGLQVGVQAHSSSDPSLRGLDVWIGSVGNYAGASTNKGLIEAFTGSVLMAGREVNQQGVIDSSTSVTLNGRIDLLASYGAVGNPSFDAELGSSLPPFLSQSTGVVRLGEGSVTRILPDYLSTKTIPGTKLPENSRINIEGLAIHFGKNSIMLAPSGDVSVRAGTWPYQDLDGNRTTLNASGSDEAGLASYIDGGNQRFLLSGGQVYLDKGALIDVSGSTDVFVALSQHLFSVQMRGSELANSPLHRDSNLRALPLIVDIRRTGVYNGREWVGTPLGDLTGLAGLIQSNVSQLTAKGGSVSIEAGDSIVMQAGATIDVSGGYFNHEGGLIQTSRLMRGRYLVDIANATPDVLYDGVYGGNHAESSQKWGVTKTYNHPLAPMGAYNQQSYVEGAAGGTISLSAPSLVLGGELLGRTIKGARQQDSPPQLGSLKLSFSGEKMLTLSALDVRFIQHSPAAPQIRFVDGSPAPVVPEFTLVNEAPASLVGSSPGEFLIGTSLFDEKESGFGNLTVDNRDGDVVFSQGTQVTVPADGSLVVRAANIRVQDDIIAPGGTVAFTAYNFSPFLYQELGATGALNNVPAPAPVAGRGVITVEQGVSINVGGMIVDDRPAALAASVNGRTFDGGSIVLEGYSIHLKPESMLDASGGVWGKPSGDFEYGAGGDIFLLAGKDPELSTTMGGTITMEGLVQAYSVLKGGSLTLQADAIQIGGSLAGKGTLIQPEFFQTGGFTSYSLIGIGARDASGAYLPGLRLAAGTTIEPRSESWVPSPNGVGGISMRPFLKTLGLRPAASVSLSAVGADDPFTQDILEARGSVVLEGGSRISTDPGANVTIKGDTVAVLGDITAPGGSITITGASSYKLPPSQPAAQFALPTVYIGANANLSAAGHTVFLPDPFGRRSGILYPGGSISVSGNIVAEAGARLDVSGASAVLDFHPTRLIATISPDAFRNAGLNSTPWGLRTVPVRVDSDGGLIELHGSQMLYSDATLLGQAGGSGALGGKLSVSSGKFYDAGADRTSADINLIVEQNGSALAFGDVGRLGNIVGLMSGNNSINGISAVGGGDLGYFAMETFSRGGFDSLDLGFEYYANASPLPYGGNVEFRGPVAINARGFVRVAGGGVIRATSPVTITAPYVAVGQPFREPTNPDDQIFPFTSIIAGQTGQYFLPPSFGAGSLDVSAQLIDIGTLSLQGVGRAMFGADGGDIRGSGSLNIAGDLVLRAAQIYPTTLATFDIYAYDHAGGIGSVSILGSGVSALPLSAGGALNVFASSITQGGTLRAPMGSITLGWDGTDMDLSDADIDPPYNPAVGSAAPIPIAQSVTLEANSVTSVSAIDSTGKGLIIPYGLSPDGLTWIDPRGVDVTVSGLPQKGISIKGASVNTEAGSLIDVRGGGDLAAYRWVPGLSGNVDILGTATQSWVSGQEYAAGDLVSFGGKTYSARVAIDPADFALSPDPSTGRYWVSVPDSYAVLPGFESAFAPYNAFNTGPNSGSLAGDPGYSSAGLRLGEQIYLQGGSGLSAGYYTLLPRRYAVLPGAYLVTPQEGGLVGSATPLSTSSLGSLGTTQSDEGSYFVSGYSGNAFDRPATAPQIFSRFEVAPPAVLAERAQYDVYSANSFMTEAALNLDASELQHLPMDSGMLTFHGNTALQLNGGVLTQSPATGRGASIDISSLADIYLIGGSGGAPANAGVVLDAGLLSSWGAESLLIGGLRRETPTGTMVDVRTTALTLDNPGAILSAPEIILVSREELTVRAGSSIASSGGLSRPADVLGIEGDGVLIRVSGDQNASILRKSVTSASAPLLTIGAGASIQGASIILDSTSAMNLDPATVLKTQALTLGSGQISIVFDNAPGPLEGSMVNSHLVLAGDLLDRAQQVRSLTLQTYRTLDLYGSGVFGSETLESLVLQGGGIRGYQQGGNTVLFQVGDVVFDNAGNVNIAGSSLSANSGGLKFESDAVRFGSNAFSISGYENLTLEAAGGILAEKTGSFNTSGNLTMSAPLMAGAQGVKQSIASAGEMNLLAGTGEATITAGLGASIAFQGATVRASSNIYLPSGELTLRATTGDLTVDGQLSVEGTSRQFYDLVQYADAGRINLISTASDVLLLAGGQVSVSAHADGGDAGTLSVSSPGGIFDSDGILLGKAGMGGESGTFMLDAATIASFDDLTTDLDAAGFFEERRLRVRTGDVTLSGATRVRKFSLSTDAGNLTVTGLIDASGQTGGSIELISRGNLTLAPTAVLTVAAQRFSNGGKGGSVYLEGGAAIDGISNPAALVDIQAGSLIDLSVAQYSAFAPVDLTAGALPDYQQVGTAAFHGLFQGTLHIRAPQTAAGNNLQVAPISGDIQGASSILIEGYRIFDLTAVGGLISGEGSATQANGGIILDPAVNVQASVKANGVAFGAHAASIESQLLANADPALARATVVTAGAEIINRAAATSIALTLATSGNSSISVPASGGSILFPAGTIGNNRISSTGGATIVAPDGTRTTLAANTPTSLAAGSTIVLANASTISFAANGTGGPIPVQLTPGSSFTTSSAGTVASVGSSGASASLVTPGSSRVDLTAGSRLLFTVGTVGTRRITSSVAGTITASNGTVTVLAANTPTAISAGSTVALNSAGTLSYTNTGTGTGTPTFTLLTGNFTTSGPVSLTPVTGNLALGTISSNNTADWNLSTYRYGADMAPGILTLRAAGDLVFNNTLSDGFTPVVLSSANAAANGNSSMWLAPLMAVNPLLPTNLQSWSYRLTAGADFKGASFRSVSSLDDLSSGLGSLLVGQFYAAVPNQAANAIGSNGVTANSILVGSANAAGGTRYEVIRTGTGDIDITTGRDVQLRNAFSTIYTAGVGFANRAQIFEPGDFAVPITIRPTHPSQGNLGAVQQSYGAYYALSGGSLDIAAQANIGRVTLFDGQVIADASRQIPTNWLYRRGQIDPATGNFAAAGITSTGLGVSFTDPSASTTWWVDYSNFFQGFGALGGGDIALVAGNDIVNADAAIPTNARMAGIDPSTGQNIAPSVANLLEHGGGDLLVKAGNNIDGGNFYVEKGTARLVAGNEITTNSAQSPSRGILGTTSSSPEIRDALTWQAVTLYGGRTHFDVSARGNILLGPTTSAFLLPQGLNNKFWYKTQFQTIGEEAGVSVASFGGGVTHRLGVTLPGDTLMIPTLLAAYRQSSPISTGAAGYYRPWLRLAESAYDNFRTMATVSLPTLKTTAFGGDINVVGTLNLFPSPEGELELLASGGIIGLNQTGITRTSVDGSTVTVTAWASASMNLSDANPASIPGVTSPLAFQQLVSSRDLQTMLTSSRDPLATVSRLFQEIGSYSGVAATVDVKTALHAETPVHANNPNPIRLYAGGGDITGFTLYSPKSVRALAERDVSDIAFYLQHVSDEDISIVSAGRDVIPFNQNSPYRSLAGDVGKLNLLVDPFQSTVVKDASGQFLAIQAMAGDLQIGGMGTLEVLAGRNIDLGSGANLIDGTGVGITSIGRSRNPFLPFEGADLVLLAGVGGVGGGPAIGLTGSTLNFDTAGGSGSTGSTPEHQALAALKELFITLNGVAEQAALTLDYSAGYDAIAQIFENSTGSGSVLTQARDIRTASGGSITIAAPGGGVTMASDIFGNPLTPPGIVTEYGGEVSILTDGNVDIGQARIFTLRGGDMTIWSSSGDIAAGSAPKTVVTAPPTRVLIDSASADIQTDLGGLATGGGIGVLASVEGVEPGNVFIVAPKGTVDAGDAGIRATGDITIAAVSIKNADTISAGGNTSGVPAAAPAAVPNTAGLSSASNASAASANAATEVANQAAQPPQETQEMPSLITVEVLGYGGEDEEEGAG